MPLNRFEVLRDRVMQREEGSGKEVVKERRKEEENCSSLNAGQGQERKEKRSR